MEGDGQKRCGMGSTQREMLPSGKLCLLLLSPLFLPHPEVKQVPSVCYIGLGLFSCQ